MAKVVDGAELKLALVGAQEAFEKTRTLTEEFVRSRIHRYVKLVPGDEDQLVEIVYQQLARALCTYDKDRAENPFSWFKTVVDHRIIDYCRANKIPVDSLDEPRMTQGEEVKGPLEPPDNDTTTPPAVHRQLESHEILFEAMAQLASPRRREMLLLVTLFPEVSYKEIMKVTKQPTVDAAKQLKYHTMKEMREILGRMGYGWEMFGEVFRPDE